ncbi:glycosyltransferase [Marinobacter sp. SS5-14b]|uniref:glycosyltransferase n=1 Tax=Marinobacter sp. SS5-14b TaxID=3050456 RepID=UPI0026DF5167|nr:glycosyltransferase [Marinobacter sp. SS5-14b]
MNIQIIYASSGLGLRKDAHILDSALTVMGHTCHQVQLRPTPEWRNRLSHFRYRVVTRYFPEPAKRLYYQLNRWMKVSVCKGPKADLVIHLENIRPSHLSAGTIHWLIPNQEWFIESRTPYLNFIDSVLCKTRLAEAIFSSRHPSTYFLGFTGSANTEVMLSLNKNFKLALHVAGNSRFKGTEALLACWQKHPEWPTLVVASQHIDDQKTYPHNLTVRKSLSDKELSNLWARAGFAIIPSEVEGYGQALAEAMSFGCVPITTDAAPMNELINKHRGYLVPAPLSQPFRLGTRYFVSEKELEKVISEALETSESTLQKMSEASAEWYRHNHADFLVRLENQINQMTEQPHGQSMQGPTETPNQQIPPN